MTDWVKQIRAKFATQCGYCEEQIDEGEPICQIKRFGWVHARCAEDEGYAVEEELR